MPLSVAQLTECLLNEEEPIAKRHRAAFALRSYNTNEAVEALAKGFLLKNNSLT